MFKKVLIIMAMAVLTACSSGVRNAPHTQDAQATPNEVIVNSSAEKTHSIRTNRNAAFFGDKALSRVYQEWVGTRYRLGGTTKRGIDCSAFTQTAFLDAYGISLPRSTAQQRYSGRQINKNELRKGDLVFFRRNHHVGIYLGNNQFMHASTSQGVTISSLNEHYWAKNYTQSRRVL